MLPVNIKRLVLFPHDLIKKISGGGQWEELGSKDWDSYYLFLSEWMFQENIKSIFFHLIISEDFKKNSENRTIELFKF